MYNNSTFGTFGGNKYDIYGGHSDMFKMGALLIGLEHSRFDRFHNIRQRHFMLVLTNLIDSLLQHDYIHYIHYLVILLICIMLYKILLV